MLILNFKSKMLTKLYVGHNKLARFNEEAHPQRSPGINPMVPQRLQAEAALQVRRLV